MEYNARTHEMLVLVVATVLELSLSPSLSLSQNSQSIKTHSLSLLCTSTHLQRGCSLFLRTFIMKLLKTSSNSLGN
jgi:hypothetical protein